MANPTPAPPAGSPAVSPGADPVAQTLALLQPWIEYVPPQQRRLGIFIFLAFLAHVATFFFISIDTTRAELRHQLRPHVTVENTRAASLAGQQPADEFWDQLNDPRLFLLPQSPAVDASLGNPALDFTPIGSTAGTSELPLPATPQGFQFVHPINPPLDQRAEDALNPPRQPFAYEENPPAIAPTTMWQWDETLAPRQPLIFPELPSPISDTELTPTRMRIAVNSRGAVEHVLVEESCGKADLDQEAVLATQKIRFHSTDQPGLLWGRITVFWHYSAAPVEEVVPTPPAGP